MYLLDTDILSNLLKRSPTPGLVSKLAIVPAERLFTSSITLSELVYGAYRLGQPRSAVLLEQIDRLLLPGWPVLPFDVGAARRYGEIRAELERRGRPIGDADLHIAATAVAHGLVMVTGNIRHFQRIPGLTVENWLE
jgi:tRNA(fMet)-specific endonuclease VapC